jgi:hypothetical protein
MITLGLFDLLLGELPPGFVQGLVDRMPMIYTEAHTSVTNDSRFGEPEARYMLGHTRRALVEYALRELAASHRMEVAIRRTEGAGGPEHVVVSAGKFCFTACHVPTAGSFPKESRHREQYSLINEHIAQGQLFPVESRPAKTSIYGVIVHSEAIRDKGNLGSLQIGFPNERFTDWVEEPIVVVDLADTQRRLYAKQDDLQSQRQAPTPKWKRRTDSRAKES